MYAVCTYYKGEVSRDPFIHLIGDLAPIFRALFSATVFFLHIYALNEEADASLMDATVAAAAQNTFCCLIVCVYVCALLCVIFEGIRSRQTARLLQCSYGISGPNMVVC